MNRLLADFLEKLKIENWLAILPLFFPLYLIKIQLLNVPTNVLEILVGGTFVIWLIFNLVRWVDNWPKMEDRAFWLKQWFYANKMFLLYSLLFWAMTVLAVLIVPQSTLLIDGQTVYESKKVALGILKGWVLIPYLYYVMLWFTVRRREILFNSLYSYIFSALPLVVWAFYQYLTGDFITADARASGPFVNANYLAMYLAPAVVALWVMIVRGILMGFRVYRFIIGAVLAVVYSIGLLMTQSYGAMLAVILTLTFFMLFTFLLHRKFHKTFEVDLIKKITFFLLTILLVVILSAGVLFARTEKWKLFADFQNRSSSSVRMEVYQISWDMIKKNPLLGIGFGQFEPQYNIQAPEVLGHAPYEWVMLHPHNTLLAVWLNFGILGLLGFVALIIYAGLRYWRSYDYELRYYRLIGITMFLVMVLHGMVDTYLFKNDLAMLFVLILSLCFLPRNFVLEGEVVGGLKIGRSIGMPTANIKINKINRKLEDLQYGVYGSIVTFKGKRYLGATSYGVRPTVEDTKIPTFEVHLIGFNEKIYGETVKVEIICWIRSMFKFNSLDELIANQKNDLKLIQSRIKL